MNVQWYPGHMAKTKRMMKESISLVDIVIELLDARIPYSSKNPDMDELAANKRRLILLNKSDLANPAATEKWVRYYEEKAGKVLMIDASTGKGMKDLAPQLRLLMKDKIDAQMKRGRRFVPVRAMVVGIPNVGKSTFINRLVGKASAKTGDKAGVTRGKQWIKIKNDVELLDTPGILWPKFEDQRVGKLIAFTGGVNDQILDPATMAQELILFLRDKAPGAIARRYGVADTGLVEEVFHSIGVARGFLVKGGDIDHTRTGVVLMDEYRGGKLGRITLEEPEDLNGQ